MPLDMPQTKLVVIAIADIQCGQVCVAILDPNTGEMSVRPATASELRVKDG